MVVIFAERGEYYDCEVRILGVSSEADATLACIHYAEKLRALLCSELNGMYEYNVRPVEASDKLACGVMKELPPGSLVLVEYYSPEWMKNSRWDWTHYQPDRDRLATSYSWCVSYKSVELFEP